MKHIQIASLKKRLLSSLIDLTLIAGLFCLFYFCVFTKVVASVQHYDHLNEVINEEKNDSGLYVNNVSLLEKNPHAGETDLAIPIKTFYTDYMHTKDEKKYDTDGYWYYVHILYLDDFRGTYEDEELVKPKEPLFSWGDQTILEVNKLSSDQNAYDTFYRSSFSSATTLLNLTDPIRNALLTMTWGNIRAALYSSMVATIIPCFIIPIALKNGKTVGKLVTKLVVLTDEGYEYKRYKHIFRYLAFYMIEVFGGVVTIGLTLILTTSLTLFTKKRRALHDYIAFSVVADEVNSVFYKDYDEEIEYQKKSLEKLSA